MSTLIVLSLAVVPACGSERPPGGNGSEGGTKAQAGSSSSRAGTSNLGGDDAMGMGGDAAGDGGTPSSMAGSAGRAPTGGGGRGGTSGGRGGAAGGGAGGSAGAGGSVNSLCGNGQMDAGEECDDGNSKNGDGCSSTCTARCEACEIANCDYGTFGDVKALCFTEKPGDVVVDGPAKGAPRSKLCTELVECIRKSGCVQAANERSITTAPFLECYCGPGGCQGNEPATGPCKNEYRRASESASADEAAIDLDVTNKLYDFVDATGTTLGLALGRASLVVQACDFFACGQDCYRGAAADACQRCSLGPDASQSSAGEMVLCINAAECAVNELCSPVLSCVRQTKCAAVSIVDCYAEGAGPCATQIAAASDGSSPAEITAQLTSPDIASTTLGIAKQVLSCQQAYCAAECFPP